MLPTHTSDCAWLAICFSIGASLAVAQTPPVIDEVRRTGREDVVLAMKPGTDPGKWQVAVSGADDTRTVTFTLLAEAEVRGRPDARSRPVLVVRCRPNEIQIHVALGMAPTILRADGAFVNIQFDEDEANWIQCYLSPDRQTAIVPDAGMLIHSIARSKRMGFEFQPLRWNPVVAEFGTRGLLAATRALPEATLWKLLDPVAHFEERIERKADYLQRWLSIDGGRVAMRMDFWRSDRSVSNLFGLISHASDPWPDAQFRVTLTGPIDRISDMGMVYSMADLCRSAIVKTGWQEDRFELVVGEELEPERYSEDPEDVELRGKIKEPRDEIVIEVLGIGW